MAKLTLEKVAKISGVSRSTVSRVMRNHQNVSPDVRERVLQVIEETGYQPNSAAQSLAGQRTNVIGLVIAEPAQSLFTDPYFPQLIQGITQVINDHNQTLALFFFHDKEDKLRLSPKILQNQLVDGLIVTGIHTNDSLVPKLLENQVPFVLIGRHEDPRVNFIDVDNAAGAYIAVNYLIRLGYKRIGTITGHMDNHDAIDRHNGYLKALKLAGYSIDDALIINGDYTEASGYIGALHLLKQDVDALFVASDGMALGALRALREAGLSAPDDIGIIGFDDFPASSLSTPPLTTVRQSVRRTGVIAVETLLDCLDNDNSNAPPRRITLPTELVIRSSCKGTSIH